MCNPALTTWIKALSSKDSNHSASRIFKISPPETVETSRSKVIILESILIKFSLYILVYQVFPYFQVTLPNIFIHYIFLLYFSRMTNARPISSPLIYHFSIILWSTN